MLQARGKYIIDKTIMDIMQRHAVVLHPLPRVDEVSGTGIHSLKFAPDGLSVTDVTLPLPYVPYLASSPTAVSFLPGCRLRLRWMPIPALPTSGRRRMGFSSAWRC